MRQIFFIVCIMRRWATSILLLLVAKQSKIYLHQTKEKIDKQTIAIVLAGFWRVSELSEIRVDEG
jgi:hypothetical protein